MSDTEEVVAAVDGDEQKTPVVAGEMDINEALREVLKGALYADGLVRGIREAAKALDKRQAHLCVLATNCEEAMYIKLVEALCQEHGIPLLKVDDNKKLGEWAGLCKLDKDSKARRVVGCSCVVVTAWGEENEVRRFNCPCPPGFGTEH